MPSRLLSSRSMKSVNGLHLKKENTVKEIENLDLKLKDRRLRRNHICNLEELRRDSRSLSLEYDT
jgi:hypothetical protein